MLTILLQVLPPFVEDSQRTIVPILPDKVSVPLLLAAQTETLEERVPGTVAGSTVIDAGLAFAALQMPLCTTAL